MWYRAIVPTGLIVLAITLAAQPSGADTIHIPADYPTIEAGLAVATAGDAVLVEPATYLEHSLVLPAGVTLVGTGVDPTAVVIDAAGLGRVLTIEGGDSRLMNLRLTRGDAAQGGGLLIQDGTVQVLAVHINDCTANLGGAVFVRTGAATIEQCLISTNLAHTAGGGVYAVDAPSLELRDTVIYGNTAGAYGGAWYTARGGLSLTGCTVLSNRADLAADGAAFGGEAGILISRTISENNTPDAGFNGVETILLSDLEGRVTSQCSVRHSPGWAGYLQNQLDDPAAHNLDADPLICFDSGSPESRFGVAANSPCLPENNPDCDLIGAYGQGCAIPIAAPDIPVARTALHPAYPNPFNPVTNLNYEIGRAGPVSLVVYGLDGRRVATLVNEDQAAGIHSATWAGLDDRGHSVASGVYICRLRAGDASAAIRMTMVK